MKHLTFKGKKTDDALGGHLLDNFTKGKTYEFWIENDYRYTKSDTDEKIMISNNASRRYFL